MIARLSAILDERNLPDEQNLMIPARSLKESVRLRLILHYVHESGMAQSCENI
jgi:hypothetical protein